MKLTTIADLQTVQDIRPYLDLVQGLGDHYLRFIEQDLEGYEYTVSAGAERDRKPGIHASEISGCARRLVYGISGIERKPDPKATDVNMRMRFRIGTAVHAMLQDDLIRMCKSGPYTGPDGTQYTLTFEPETRITSETPGPAADYGVESSSDGVFTFWLGSLPVLRLLLEIKTSSKDEYDKLTQPKPEHTEQTHLYMACLDIPLTWLWYYNKSNSNFTKPYPPFLFRFSEKLWSGLEARFVLNTHRAERNELPPRTESIACRWCPFGYTCGPTILQKGGAPVSSAISTRQLGMRKR